MNDTTQKDIVTAMTINLPTHVSTFSALARTLEVNRSWLADLRNRENRFPSKSSEGWPVIAVGLLLAVRDLERTSDQDHAARLQAAGIPADLDARRELIADHIEGMTRNA